MEISFYEKKVVELQEQAKQELKKGNKKKAKEILYLKIKKKKIKKLEILDIGANQITDISVLQNVNFKELKELNLNSNEITDIKVLENVNFKGLITLYLDCNPIDYDSTFVENLKIVILV